MERKTLQRQVTQTTDAATAVRFGEKGVYVNLTAIEIREERYGDTHVLQILPKDGDKGDKGESPALVFRGIYDSQATYYGNNYRVDAVEYDGQYYIARIDAGTFSAIAPPDTNKWNSFGATFDSVATNLLLAEGAKW